jgi:dTDP-4-amino-4,6-dideoxygalactose transaminase
MEVRNIERRITPRTKAIMPVHMLGNLCNMDNLKAFESKYGWVKI